MEQVTEETSVATREAARDLKALVRRLRPQLMEAAATEERTASQAAVLSQLELLGDSSTSELAGAEGIRPQSMATILRALESHGLVQGRADPADGCRRIITLTPVGRDRALAARAMRDEWLAEALQNRFTSRERPSIADARVLLGRVVTP